MIDSPLARFLLRPPAKLYEMAIRARNSLYENKILETRRLNAPVISVGNLTVGGTGKTPCVAYIAKFLRDQGQEVAILSRGYKRESRGRVEVSDGKRVLCSPRESGDEPYLLAVSCPGVRVVVDSDRFAAGRWLETRAGVSVFILDDGYQHLRLARDLNLVLIDATDDLSGAKMIPFGRLREPLAGLQRADAAIVTRSDRAVDRATIKNAIEKYSKADAPVFFASYEMTGFRRLVGEESVEPADFAGKKIAAFSGIARPDGFVEDLARLRLQIAMRRDFEDHHRYSGVEFGRIVNEALTAGAEAIVTTEKDAANIPHEFVESLTLPIFAAQIEFRCENESKFKSLLGRVLSSQSGVSEARPSGKA